MKENPHSLENRWGKNKMCYAVDIYNDGCHTCIKGNLDSSSNEAGINKLPLFSEIHEIHNF